MVRERSDVYPRCQKRGRSDVSHAYEYEASPKRDDDIFRLFRVPDLLHSNGKGAGRASTSKGKGMFNYG